MNRYIHLLIYINLCPFVFYLKEMFLLKKRPIFVAELVPDNPVKIRSILHYIDIMDRTATFKMIKKLVFFSFFYSDKCHALMMLICKKCFPIF